MTVTAVDLHFNLLTKSGVGFFLVWLLLTWNTMLAKCGRMYILYHIRFYSINFICRARPLPVFSSGNNAEDYIKADKSYSLQVIVGYDIINITLYTMEQYPS